MNKIHYYLLLSVILSCLFNTFGQKNGDQILIPKYKQVNSSQLRIMPRPGKYKAVPEKAQSVNPVLPNNGYYSATSKGPDANAAFQRTAYLITSQEFSKALFPSSVTINSIGFNIYSQPPSSPLPGHLKVYLSNTSDTVFTKTSDWTTIITGMTLAEDDSINIPSSTGTYDLTFNGGLPFVYSGGSVYIAFEWVNTGIISAQNTEYLVNTNLANGLKYSTSVSSLPATLGLGSNSRPETRLGYSIINDGSVDAVYTLGNYPLNSGNLNPISTVVTNRSDNNLLGLAVTLNIKGSETFNDSYTIPLLAPGTSTVVTFSSFIPSITGSDTITVSLPADSYNNNNSKSFIQDVNGSDYFSYFNNNKYYSTLGYSSGNGSLVARYKVDGNLILDSVSAFITEGTGKTIRGVAYNAAGSLIAQTNEYTILSSDSGRLVSLKFNILPNVTNQDIFVGIGLLDDGFYPIGLEAENPTRLNTFFSCALEGGSNTFSDLAFYNYGIPMIEAFFNQNAVSQIYSPDGLNMPGDFTGWINPPAGKAFSGIQNPVGTLLPAEWKYKANVLITRIYSTLINIRSGGDTTGGTYQFLFTSGSNANYSLNKWGGVSVTPNTIQNYIYNSSINNSVSLSNGYYYTVNWIDNGYNSTKGLWMPTTGVPVTITGVIDMHKPLAGVPDSALITINKSKSAEENIFIKNTKDSWITWNIVQAVSKDSTHYIAVIPGSEVTANPDLNKYYAFTSTMPVGTLQSFTNFADLDLAVISIANNGGAGYSLPNNFLPVELTSFIAKVNGRNVEINWATASETGNLGFHVERNSGNNSWVEIGYIQGSGTTAEQHNYSYTDKNLAPGKYQYRLKQVDVNGKITFSNAITTEVDIPKSFNLSQNYPNPFNPSTKIDYQLPLDSKVKLELFSITGAKVGDLVNDFQVAGNYSIVMNSNTFRHLSSGVYFYRLTAGSFISTRKLMLLK